MRVSTNILFNGGRDAIQRQYADMFRTQQQLATGKRLVSPSDDPVAAARAVEVSQSQSVNAQYRENQTYALNALRFSEGTLSSVSDTLIYVRTRMLEAGNPLHGQGERDAIAADLRAQFEQLRSLANTRDAEGNFIFSGALTETEPFSGGIGGVNYEGDNFERRLQVSSNRQIEVGIPGDRIFGNVFDGIEDLIVALENPALDNGQVLAQAATSIGRMDEAVSDVMRERSAVGSRLVELEALDYLTAEYDLQYAETLSRIQDLDFVEAISRYARQQTQLEAAQQTYTRLTGLSLFNFLR